MGEKIEMVKAELLEVQAQLRFSSSHHEKLGWRFIRYITLVSIQLYDLIITSNALLNRDNLLGIISRNLSSAESTT